MAGQGEKSDMADQGRVSGSPRRALIGVVLIFAVAFFLAGLFLQTGEKPAGIAALLFGLIGLLVAYRKIYLGIIVPSKATERRT